MVDPTKRKYNTSKFRGAFKEGHAIHGKLMLVARSYFFIYLDIPEEAFEQLVQVATGGGKVDTFSDEYDAACTRLSEWRKNWWSRMMKEAKTMQWQLMSLNSRNDLPESALLNVSLACCKVVKPSTVLILILRTGVFKQNERRLHQPAVR